jgi:hypothetical protein
MAKNLNFQEKSSAKISDIKLKYNVFNGLGPNVDVHVI